MRSLKRTISILGCGWLGLPLAERLLKEGYLVKGSTTSSLKLPLLQEKNIQAFVLRYEPFVSTEQVREFFQSDVLFLNIPFRRQLPDPHYYQQQVNAVIADVLKSPIKHVIFASSTSIYDPYQCEAIEDEPIRPHDDRAKVLLNIEKNLMSHTSFQTTIIRFAGLYGPNRTIGKFFNRATQLPPANSPVNLIHLEDCLNIICLIIKKQITQEIFNACSDQHPLKGDLYVKAAQRLGVAAPLLETTKDNIPCKIVSNEKLKTRLNYRFIHPNPLESVDA